jgi:Amt family ammonium transporter
MCNGTIAGMVAICAGANTVYPWAAWVIGFGGGVAYKFWSIGIKRAGVDDPIDAAAVHLGAGAWGVFAVTLFAMDKEAPLNQYGMGGIFYDAFDRAPWVRLGWNMLGLVCILTWTAVNMFALFFVLHKTGQLRVDDEIIASEGGLDRHEHGEFAYVLNPRLQTPNVSPHGSTTDLSTAELGDSKHAGMVQTAIL